MTPERNDLRFRMLLAFILLGGLLGPALTGTLLFVSHELEERAVERVLEQRLARVVSRPDQYRLQTAPGAGELQVHGPVPLAELPPAILVLPDGMHEFEAGDREWFIALTTRSDGSRYATVEETTALDQRKYVSRLTLAGGVLFAVLLATGAGFHISGRILQPVADLARKVAGEPRRREGRFRDVVPHNDEVGALAQALDTYHERMDEAWRREHEFAADASHELRTPLTVIQNAAELIDADNGLSDRTRRATRRILDASAAMRETVTGLLLLAHEPTADEHFETVPLRASLMTVVEACRVATGADVQVTIEAHPTIAAPRVALEVVIGNLLRNAIRHGWGKPVVVVLARECLTVTDHGAGMPAAELVSVTSRGRRATTASANGAGLGLSLANRLCKRFGWSLDFDSTEGVGTTAQWAFRPSPVPD